MDVAGINSLVFYKTPHQNILLLGEAHRIGKCPPEKQDVYSVGDYVEMIFESKPDDKCLDFFTEIPTKKSYRTKHLNLMYNSGLDETYDFFFPLSRNKKFKTRFHFIDARTLDKNFIDTNEIYEIFQDYGPNSPYSLRELYKIAISRKKCEDYDFEDFKELGLEKEIIEKFVEVVTIEDLLHVLAYLLDINAQINRDYFVKFIKALEFFSGNKFFTSYKDLFRVIGYLLNINPEINRDYFKRFKKALEIFTGFRDKILTSYEDIEEWEEEYFKILRKELSKIDTSMIKVLEFKKYLLRANLECVYSVKYFYSMYGELISCITTIPMDAYTLSRLFIKFKEDKPERACNGKPISHVIIHTGSYHTDIYDNFLEQVFGPPEIRIKNEDNTDLCLEVPEFDFWER